MTKGVAFTPNGTSFGANVPARVTIDAGYVNDAIAFPVGNTAQRPVGSNGYIRYNNDLTNWEGFKNGVWSPIAGGVKVQNNNVTVNTTSTIDFSNGPGVILNVADDYVNNRINVFVDAAVVVIPGSNTQVLFNNNGVMGANANLTFDKAASTLKVTGIVNGADIVDITDGNVTIGAYTSSGPNQAYLGTVTAHPLNLVTNTKALVILNPNSVIQVNGVQTQIQGNTAQPLTITSTVQGVYVTWKSNNISVGDVGSGDQLISGGVTIDFGIAARTTGNIFIATGATPTERIRILTTGQVGINTASPNNQFQIVSATDDAFRLMARSAAQATYQTWYDSNGTRRGYFGYDSTGGNNLTLVNEKSGLLRLGTNQNVAVNIDQQGNVGIGTASPSTNLDVNGQIYSEKSNGTQIILNSSGTYYGVIANPNNQIWSLGYGGGGVLTGGQPTVNVLTWTATGNVGIGTIAPDALFRIAGTNYQAYMGYTNSLNYFDANTTHFRSGGGTEFLTVDTQNQRLTVTSNQAGSLVDLTTTSNVSSAGVNFIRYLDSNASGTLCGYVGFTGFNNEFDIYNSRNGTLNFWTKGLNRATIAATGEFGINATPTAAALTVGAPSSEAVRFVGAAAPYMTWYNGGGTTRTGFIQGISGTGGAGGGTEMAITLDAATSSDWLSFLTAATRRARCDGIGVWTFNAPSSGTGPTFTVAGPVGGYTVRINGNSTAGSSFGLDVGAGVNSSDQAMRVMDQTRTNTYMTITGDGSGTLGYHGSATPTIRFAANGAVSINAVATVAGLSISGAADGSGEALRLAGGSDAPYLSYYAGGVTGTRMGYIQFASNSAAYLAVEQNIPLNIQTNSINRVVVESTGDLDIGSNTSVFSGAGRRTMKMSGSSDTLFDFSSANVCTGYIYAASAEFRVAAYAATAPLNFYTNNLFRATIDPTGNVGINTSAPRANLDVMGNARANTHQDRYANIAVLTANTNFDCNRGTYQDFMLAGNINVFFQNCATSGNSSVITLYIRQSANGGNTVTWANTVRWSDNIIPTLSATKNTADMITFTTFNGGTVWLGIQVMGNVPLANIWFV